MQVAAHIGEIDIAAIDKARGVTLARQRPRQARQATAAVVHLHQRRRRQPHPSAQQRHQAPVRAEIVGIAVRKKDPLVCQAHNIRTHRIVHHHIPSAAFPHDDEDVGTLSSQQGVAYGRIAGEEWRNGVLYSLLVAKRKFVLQVLRFGQRMHHIEHRVQRSVVAEWVLRKISIRHIGGRFADAAAHPKENDRCQRHKQQRPPAASDATNLARRRTTQKPQYQRDNNGKRRQRTDDSPPAHAGQHILRIHRIHQVVRVKLRAPKPVEDDVGNQHRARQQRHNDPIRGQHHAQRKTAPKAAQRNNQQRNGQNIRDRDGIQTQPVPERRQARRQRSTVGVAGIDGQKSATLHGENQKQRCRNTYQKQ